MPAKKKDFALALSDPKADHFTFNTHPEDVVERPDGLDKDWTGINNEHITVGAPFHWNETGTNQFGSW